jgi:hypothetical protein
MPYKYLVFDVNAGFGEIVIAQGPHVACSHQGVNPVFIFAYITTAGNPESD